MKLAWRVTRPVNLVRGISHPKSALQPKLRRERDHPRPRGRIFILRGEAPITIIAPTGSGEGVSCLIPLFLTHPGPVLVVDLRGEPSALNGRRRREMGRQVAVIDPGSLAVQKVGRWKGFADSTRNWGRGRG